MQEPRWIRRAGWAALAVALTVLPQNLRAQSCTPQSQMAQMDRDAIAQAAQALAVLVQADNAPGVRARTIAKYQQDFDGIAASIAATAPHIMGATLSASSIYLLDASSNAAPQDTQFFCGLSNSAEVIFSIPALPPGKYALATVRAEKAQTAWQLSLILQQMGGEWKLAGFIPRAATAAGHDGVWYWTQARQFAKQGQRWNAWLYYTEADALLTPVEFVSSPNRDKLHTEQMAAQPAELASGLSAEHPIIVASMIAGGQPYSVTALGVQESLDGKTLELAMHIAVGTLGDAAGVRGEGMDALQGMLKAHVELRGAFGGAWVYADAPGLSSFGMEFEPLPLQ